MSTTPMLATIHALFLPCALLLCVHCKNTSTPSADSKGIGSSEMTPTNPTSSAPPSASTTETTTTPSATSSSSNAAAPGNMRPRDPIPFTRGPSVTPSKDLVLWLDKQITAKGEPRLVRLPVIVKQGQVGFTGAGARVGNAPDALTIDVDDTMLGIGLSSRARTACPKEKLCALWLDGYWRGKTSSAGGYAFDVKYVGDPIPAEKLSAASYAEVGEGDVGSIKKALK